MIRPRCPYPHEFGTTSPQTPDEWMKACRFQAVSDPWHLWTRYLTLSSLFHRVCLTDSRFHPLPSSVSTKDPRKYLVYFLNGVNTHHLSFLYFLWRCHPREKEHVYVELINIYIYMYIYIHTHTILCIVNLALQANSRFQGSAFQRCGSVPFFGFSKTCRSIPRPRDWQLIVTALGSTISVVQFSI